MLWSPKIAAASGPVDSRKVSRFYASWKNSVAAERQGVWLYSSGRAGTGCVLPQVVVPRTLRVARGRPSRDVRHGRRVRPTSSENVERRRCFGPAPGRRPPASSNRVPSSTRAPSSKRSSSSARSPREVRAPRPAPNREPRPASSDCQRGFVVKLRLDEPHGYISADDGGAEIRFEPSAVKGDKRFMALRIGDSVEFTVRAETRDTRTPESDFVIAIEREEYFVQTQLARHPRARRKKPTWR